MSNFLNTLRRLLLACLFAPLWASAGYVGVSNVTFVQVAGTPIVTNLGNGTSLWRTDLTWTNNNAFATNPLYFVNTSMWINGLPSSATEMTWNDSLGRFEKGASTGTADSEALYVEVADTDLTGLGFGIGAADALAAFSIGALGAGQSITTQVNFVMSNDVSQLWFNGTILQQVPVPATLALTALALALLPATRRPARVTAAA